MFATEYYHKKFTNLFNSSPLKKYLQLNNTAYVNMDKDGGMFFLSNNPAWANRMLEKKYYLYSPIIVSPQNIDNGFSYPKSTQEEGFDKLTLAALFLVI